MEDFQVTVVDASGTDVDVRPDPFPTMAVTRLQPLAP
jgi:hypothetical protein